MTVFDLIDTPDGPFAILEDDGEVLASGWTDDPGSLLARIRPADRPVDVARGPAAAADAVRAYYAGEVEAIRDVSVRQHGTDLQRAGWRALRDVPAGAPLTYTAFAAALGRPSAVRAAAAICARNAPALFVPCHRVLRSDGSLGGFAWGEPIKRSLLSREEAQPGR